MTRSFVLTKDAIAKILEEVKIGKLSTWKCLCIQLQRNEIKNSNSEKVWKNCEQGHPKILASSKIIVPELIITYVDNRDLELYHKILG